MRAELFWIDTSWPGRLAIAARPRGGDWLEEEVQSWRQAAIDVLVSLLTTDELSELELTQEADLCEEAGITFISFPILDRSVPLSTNALTKLLRELETTLAEGKNVAIHCRAGIGRSALVAACLLVLAGVEPGIAFDQISTARGFPVPETTEQREWVRRFAAESGATIPQNR